MNKYFPVSQIYAIENIFRKPEENFEIKKSIFYMSNSLYYIEVK